MPRFSNNRINTPYKLTVTAMQPVFQQILAELHRLHAQIQLRLPAAPQVVQQQLLHLARLQQQLETLEATVCDRLRTAITASTYLTYLTLTQLIHTMIQDVVSLKHLAEEYPIDPEGTTACLREMPKHPCDLLARLNPSYETHKQLLANFLKPSSPLHKTQPVLARHS